MFTGLVEALGEVAGREPTSGGVRIAIRSPLAGELAPGQSVAVNGVCLTVIRSGAGQLEADVGPETLKATTLGHLGLGASVNLERPLRADGRLGGHFVQGHVDAVGRIERLQPEAEFHWLTVSFPPEVAPYVVSKGSIAVDGISLTVASLSTDEFKVQLVPFTMEHTNLRAAQPRDHVNLECDVVGKYVVRAVHLAGLDAKLRS